MNVITIVPTNKNFLSIYPTHWPDVRLPREIPQIIEFPFKISLEEFKIRYSNIPLLSMPRRVCLFKQGIIGKKRVGPAYISSVMDDSQNQVADIRFYDTYHETFKWGYQVTLNTRKRDLGEEVLKSLGDPMQFIDRGSWRYYFDMIYVFTFYSGFTI